jgi:hypothetical protein
LHAAQGLRITVGDGGGGEDDEEGEWERGVDEVVVFIVFVSLHDSILASLKYVYGICLWKRRERERERERDQRDQVRWGLLGAQSAYK